MGTVNLLMIIFAYIVNFSTASDNVFPNHLTYSRIIETTQQKLNSHINRSFKRLNILKDFSFSPEVDEKTFLAAAHEKLSESFPNASFSTAQEQSTAICLNQTVATLTAIAEGKEWAIRMFDAADKLPSGILDGNTLHFGSYDECLKIRSDVNNSASSVYIPNYQGQYCLSSIVIPLELFQGATFTTGVCMPDGCNNVDATTVLNLILPLIRIGGQPVYAEWVACKDTTVEYDTRAIAMISMCAFFVLLMVSATIYDIVFIQMDKGRETKEINYSPENNGQFDIKETSFEKTPLLGEKPTKPEIYKPGIAGQLLLAFSVYSNGAKILSTKTSPGTLTCINGIRFLSMSWVILGHTYIFGIGMGSNVAAFLPEMLDRWTFEAVANALLSVDSFFALSGLLVSYLALKEMKRNDGRLNWAMFYFHRFWRLTPPYMLILGVEVCLSRYWSDGPYWPKDGFEQNYCEDTWWKNLLYINNIVDGKNQCFGWAWYLANDMQFYVLSPLMFVPLYFFKGFGIFVSLLFLLASFITTYVVSADGKLPPGLYARVDAVTTGDYGSDYYQKPYCRIGPYIIGIITGYLLYLTNGRCKMHWAVNLFGWLVATILGCLVLYGLYDKNDDPMTVEVAAVFNATHRAVWGACLCWVIFACATGNGGYINKLLSWEGFSPLSRLTYCAYLVHPLVIYVYYYSRRVPVYFSDIEMIMLFLAFLFSANLVAFVASLAFESPMMGLEKVIFRRGNKS